MDTPELSPNGWSETDLLSFEHNSDHDHDFGRQGESEGVVEGAVVSLLEIVDDQVFHFRQVSVAEFPDLVRELLQLPELERHQLGAELAAQQSHFPTEEFSITEDILLAVQTMDGQTGDTSTPDAGDTSTPQAVSRSTAPERQTYYVWTGFDSEYFRIECGAFEELLQSTCAITGIEILLIA